MIGRLWVLIPTLLLVVSACRGKGDEETPSPVSPAASPSRVEVTSNYSLPLEIFAVGSGINQRLGTVYSGMARSFVIPPAMLGSGSVEFQARPTAPGGAQFRSGPILVGPGRTVDLRLTPQLFNSTATIRP